MLYGKACCTGTKKLPKLNISTIQVKILSQIGPKIAEDGEKCRKSNLDLGQFFSILRHFKGYQTAFGVCRMARGVTLVPKMSKTLFCYSTSQNIEPKWAKN